MAAAHDGVLQVRRISPSGQNVPAKQEVVIQFDRAMVSLGHMSRKAQVLPVKISPNPGCQWRWLNISELACRLPGQHQLAPATKYTLTIGTDIKALDGSHLARPLVRHFTTALPKVDWARFNHWRSPIQPVYVLYLTLPVTSKELASHLDFVDAKGRRIAVKVSPFTDKRSGPLLLPVPALPGAVMAVEHPQPDMPLDMHADAASGRRVWRVLPARPLAAAMDYSLRIRPGMHTPLGSLPGTQKKSLDDLSTYGPFTFRGVACRDDKGESVQANATAQNPRRCMLGGARLLFSSAVPRTTLEALRWQPQPLPADKMIDAWKNVPDWRLQGTDWADARDESQRYTMPFALAPMQTYAVTAPAGVKDHFGRVLTKPVTVHFRTGHYRPFLQQPGDVVLESGQQTIAPLLFTNLQSLSLRWQKRDASELVGKHKVTVAHTLNLLKQPSLDVATDHITQGALGIRDLLGENSGVVWGKLRWSKDFEGEIRHGKQPLLAQVTPFEVVTKVGHDNTLVWVNRWDNGQPVAGARVHLVKGMHDGLDSLTYVGKSVTTDASGLAVLPGAHDFPLLNFSVWDPYRGFFVVVTQGDASAVLPLQMAYGHSVGDVSDYTITSILSPQQDHLRLWAVTEQGIYKPGSMAKFALFMRAMVNAGLKPAPLRDYTVSVRDPNGKQIFRRKHVKLSAYGGWHGQVELPAKTAMGQYAIMLSWADGDRDHDRIAGYFRVADFVPAKFNVRTQIHGLRLGPGEKLSMQVDATLHAGGPYTDAAVKFTTRLLPEPFAPDTPVTAGYTFGDDDPDQFEPIDIDEHEGMLNHAGHAAATVTLPDKREVAHGEVIATGAVQSARGKWIANTARVPYDATDRYVGLRTPDWMQTSGKPFRVDWLVVNADGRIQPGSKVVLVLQRHVDAEADGDSDDADKKEWVTQAQCRAVSAKAPDHCRFTPSKAGSYRVVATVTDTQSHTQKTVLHTWVTGAGEVTWSTSDGVTLVPDKDTYHVGDTAHVLVQNPYPGTRALVTVERMGVLWKKLVTLRGSAPVIDVPIRVEDFPGAFLSVTIFKPRTAKVADPDKGKPALALGYLSLKVTGKGPALVVKVTPAHSQYRPRQQVAVDVAVHTQAGKIPGKTRLVVAVVNQGVLDLLPQGTGYYDPGKVFYAPPEGLDLMNFSLEQALSSALRPKRQPVASATGSAPPKIIKMVQAPAPGPPPPPAMEQNLGAVMIRAHDLAPTPPIRHLFRNAIYWNASLETDAAGHAHFQFKLPDNLTRWRILVIAVRPGAAMGLGDGSVRVNLPVQIAPALPNQVHVGDRFAAVFQVTNRTKEALLANTRIQSQGAIHGDKAEVSRNLALTSLGHGLAWLQLKAARPGDITLTATAQTDKAGDAVQATIPVRPAGTEVVAAEYGSLTGKGTRVPVKLPAKALPGTGQVSVTFAPTLVGGLDGAFVVMRDDLLHSWEVRLSRAVLASDYLSLKPVLGNSMHWPKAQEAIDTTMQSAAKYQTPDGGMAFWIADKRFVSPYLSVYTALAFDWLQEAGSAPPAAVHEKLWNYLHKQVLTGKHAPVLRAGALAALALSPHGKLGNGAVAAMLPELSQLRLFGQALLLQAAVASHDRRSADAIVRALFNHAEESAGGLSFNERQGGIYVDLLASPLRSNCAILDALSRYHTAWGDENLVGSTAQKLVRWVSSRRRNQGGWPNSQENVFCTSAIVHYADAYETPVKALTGSVHWLGRKPATANFASRAAPAIRLDGPEARPGRNISVDLTRRGQGRLYYGVQLHYVMPPDALPAADAGMTVTRSYAVKRDKAWQPVTTRTVLQRGDLVRVDLMVDTPTERHHVVLSDPLSGAFEAVNPHLATSTPGLPSRQPEVGIVHYESGSWPRLSFVTGGFYHREMGFDAVRFFADNLPAGRYHLTYTAQVIAPGTFLAPAPTVKEIYQPDVFGRGLPQQVRVAMPEQ